MKDRTYYVVKVSYRETNPAHRVVCYHRYNGLAYLYSAGYDGEENHHVDDLYYFNVISEIEEMNVKK